VFKGRGMKGFYVVHTGEWRFRKVFGGFAGSPWLFNTNKINPIRQENTNTVDTVTYEFILY